jgi:predicted PurR-regulated permease PerM
MSKRTSPFPVEPPDEPAPKAQPASSRSEVKKLRELLEGPFGIRSPLSLTGLFVLAAFYTLYFCRSFLLPVVLAVLLSLLLSPVVRGLKRLHVPEAVGSGLVLLILLGAFGTGLYQLAGPAYDWMQRAPQSLRKMDARLRELKKPVLTLGKATEQVEKIAEVSGGGPKPAAVAVQAPSLRDRLFSQATELAVDGVVMFVLLFFLLASGDLFLRKLVRVLPRVEDKLRAVEIARRVQRQISAYLSTLTMINVMLGVAVWVAMSLIGLPNPQLWGAMVAVTNFVPYLGPAVNYAVLAMVGFLTFDTLRHALLPPAVFLVLNVLESWVISPMIMGRRMTLNPVVLFLALTFWGWMWGIVGAILAVPIMVVTKILCDHVEPLAPIGEFLGD